MHASSVAQQHQEQAKLLKAKSDMEAAASAERDALVAEKAAHAITRAEADARATELALCNQKLLEAQGTVAALKSEVAAAKQNLASHELMLGMVKNTHAELLRQQKGLYSVRQILAFTRRGVLSYTLLLTLSLCCRRS